MTAKTVSLTIDGKTVQAEENSLVIEAARKAGIGVPHYCYHPALGNPGVCRLCMVEVEGMPKLQVSCRLPVKEGMAVRSNSPAARRAQASSLELHLVNHPLDCPVCDQAGECKLQDYYMRYGLYESAVREDKSHKHKRLDIGRHIMLDTERCILCTRCTRFLDNVTKTHELGIFNRGDRSELLPYPGMTVDNPYSGNIADVCPVGALTDKDFRFKVRVWYLDRAPSVCTGCARGCSIEIHSNTQRPWHTDGARVARLLPRKNPEVNGWWICDEGRYGFKSIDAESRIKAPSALAEGKLRRVSWEEALEAIGARIRDLSSSRGPKGLAVVLSGTLSNEDLYLARHLFADAWKAGHILVRPGPDQLGEEDDLLRRREKVPNLRGAQAMGFGSSVKESSWDSIRRALESGSLWGLWVVDRDPVSIWGEASVEAVKKLPFTLFQGANMNRFAVEAGWVLPACSYAEEEATFTNFEGHVQRTWAAFPPLAEARPEWSAWRAFLEAHGVPFAEDGAAGVFDRICRTEGAFKGLSWEGLGHTGRKLKT